MSILNNYKSPRDAIPEIVSRLDNAWRGGGTEQEILDRMGLEPVRAVELLMLEIHRLRENNMVHCRRAAKRAITSLETRNQDLRNIAISEMNHIVKIVDEVDSGGWWK